MNLSALTSLPVLVAFGFLILLVLEFSVQRSKKLSDRKKNGLSFTFFIIALILAGLTIWNEYINEIEKNKWQLTDAQKSELVSILKIENEPRPAMNAFCLESEPFCAQWRKVFVDAGWLLLSKDLGVKNTAEFWGIVKGVKIAMSPKSNSKFTDKAKAAFDYMNIKYSFKFYDKEFAPNHYIFSFGEL